MKTSVVSVIDRHIKNPYGAPPDKLDTLSRWNLLLGSLAQGTPLEEAMQQHFVTRAEIEAAVRSDPKERVRWDEARSAQLKRSWSVFDFEDIFAKIAGGATVSKAICEVRGLTEKNMAQTYSVFNRIILSDPVLHEQYLTALKARALAMQEDVLDLSNDDSKDIIHNDKGPAPNNAAVNRSKLQVETRMRLMGAWHTRMFGESKNQVQVNVQVNHAEKLEAARSRAVVRGTAPEESAPKRISQAVVDAAFAEVPEEKPPADQDLSWMDEPPKPPPMDLSWLE